MPRIFASLNGGHFTECAGFFCSHSRHSRDGVIVKFCSTVKLRVFSHCTKATPRHFPVLQHPHNYKTQCRDQENKLSSWQEGIRRPFPFSRFVFSPDGHGESLLCWEVERRFWRSSLCACIQIVSWVGPGHSTGADILCSVASDQRRRGLICFSSPQRASAMYWYGHS